MNLIVKIKTFFAWLVKSKNNESSPFLSRHSSLASKTESELESLYSESSFGSFESVLEYPANNSRINFNYEKEGNSDEEIFHSCEKSPEKSLRF
jgi:hypothetical protein